MNKPGQKSALANRDDPDDRCGLAGQEPPRPSNRSRHFNVELWRGLALSRWRPSEQMMHNTVAAYVGEHNRADGDD